MLEIERTAALVVADACMGRAERLGLGPGLERGLALPHRVRGVERVVFGFRPLEQVEFDEPRHGVQLRVTVEPHLLEGFFRATRNAEPIHGDKHGNSSVCELLAAGWRLAAAESTGCYRLSQIEPHGNGEIASLAVRRCRERRGPTR